MQTFRAKTIIAAVGATLLALMLTLASGGHAQQSTNRGATGADGCRMECPTSRQANEGANCRLILRTDGKSARLCEPVKCKRVCSANQHQHQHQHQHQQHNLNLNQRQQQQRQQQQRQQQRQPEQDLSMMEQQIEPAGNNPERSLSENGQGASSQSAQATAIWQQRSGKKLKQAPVLGGAGRAAPTLAPETSDDDSPPLISRFLDVSPEE